MALNLMKRDIAGPGDAADFQASLHRYSLTDRAPVECANQTEANQIAAQLEADGHLEAFPLFCYIGNLQRHMCKPAPGDPWVILGGRLHGAQARVDRNTDPSVETEMHVNATDGFLRQSVGFTRAPSGGVLIPEDGLYRINLGGRVENTYPSETGRRYVRLKLNDAYLGGRVEFEGDAHFALSTEWLLKRNDVVMSVGYQAIKNSAGNTSRRVISATLGIYQSLTPSW